MPVSEHKEELALAPEIDPQFHDENGRFSPVKWEEYIKSRPATVKSDEEENLTPRTAYEKDFIRLVHRVIDWCRWVETSQSQLWPRNADGSLPGTPWDQPFWRRRLMDAFWDGQYDMRSDRQKQT